MSEARNSLVAALEAEGSAVVALSGGVDSATLAVLSHLALGGRSLAVTGVSASLSRHQQGLVESVLRAHPMPHEWLATDELASVDYRRNGPDRCFHCKDELYRRLREVADARGFPPSSTERTRTTPATSAPEGGRRSPTESAPRCSRPGSARRGSARWPANWDCRWRRNRLPPVSPPAFRE